MTMNTLHTLFKCTGRKIPEISIEAIKNIRHHTGRNNLQVTTPAVISKNIIPSSDVFDGHLSTVYFRKWLSFVACVTGQNENFKAADNLENMFYLNGCGLRWSGEEHGTEWFNHCWICAVVCNQAITANSQANGSDTRSARSVVWPKRESSSLPSQRLWGCSLSKCPSARYWTLRQRE